MRSLRRLSFLTFLTTAILLAVLVFTGFRQNSLMSDYSAIVKESESTIFFYSTIREQTTEGLLSRTPTQLLAAAREIEKLQGRYTAMLDNRLIPSQYKLSFLQNLDRSFRPPEVERERYLSPLSRPRFQKENSPGRNLHNRYHR